MLKGNYFNKSKSELSARNHAYRSLAEIQYVSITCPHLGILNVVLHIQLKLLARKTPAEKLTLMIYEENTKENTYVIDFSLDLRKV